MKLVILCVPLLAIVSGCLLVPDGARPKVQMRGEIRDKWVRRGMPQNEEGVLQGRATAVLPTRWSDPEDPDETIAVETFANMDLSDSTGDAWFADGNSGRVTAFDLIGSYTFTTEAFGVSTGIVNYNLPFGPFFPNGPRGSTNEVFAIVGADVLGARPEVELHYDFDQGDGFYFNFGLSEEFELMTDLRLILRGGIGYVSDNQALWDYGIAASGFADLEGGIDLRYDLGNHTAIGIDAAYTTMVDDDLRDWFDLIGIETGNFAVGLYGVVTY